jgi:hypothetical protein
MSAGPEVVRDDVLAATRSALHQVAVHVLARRRHAVTGRFGLRPSPGGLATPAFGPPDAVEVVRICGATLVVEQGASVRHEVLTTLGRAADLVGVDLAAPFSVGHDTPTAVDPDAALPVDDAAARLLGDWWALGAAVIDRLCTPGDDADRPLVAAATTAQTWPEHFDHATVVTVATGGEEPPMANVGASPGDGGEPLPYLFVGPHGPERPGDDGYWNAPFGAVLRRSALAGLPDGEARRKALAFLRDGLVRLAAAVRP